jgi:hypothetical protein
MPKPVIGRGDGRLAMLHIPQHSHARPFFSEEGSGSLDIPMTALEIR